MNDPLYGHPAWKVGGASDSANVDHVISEIVKSNYTSKSHDQIESADTPVGTGSSDEVVDGTKSIVCEEPERVKVQTVSEEHCSNLLAEAGGQTVVESKGQSTEAATEVSELVREKELRDDNSSELSGRSQERQLNAADLPVDSEVSSSCDPDCTECRTVHPDPTPSELMMYLHALSYKVSIIPRPLSTWLLLGGHVIFDVWFLFSREKVGNTAQPCHSGHWQTGRKDIPS